MTGPTAAATPTAPERTPEARPRRLLPLALAVFVATAAALALGSATRDPWRTDEHRYLEAGRVMAVGDGSWWVPHLNGEVYPKKPPLVFWAEAALLRLGASLRWALALPAVLGAATVAALTFALGARLFGVGAGLAAALTLASTELFVSLGVRGNLDAPLTAFTTLALAVYWCDERRRASGRRSSWALAAASGLAAGAGALVKGPVAVAIPLAVIAAHRAAETGWRALADRRLPVLVVASALPASAWLAGAYAEGGASYLRELLLGHAVGHAMGGTDKQHPPWFYLKHAPVSLLPWTLLLPAAAVALRGARRTSAERFAIAWALAPFVLLSAFPAKRNLYLLPLVPGVALLHGWLLARVASGSLPALGADRVWGACRRLLAAVALGASAALALAAASARPESGSRWLALLAESRDLVPYVVLAALLLGAAGVALWRARAPRAQTRAALALAPVVFFLLAFVFHPLESRGRSPRSFYEQVAARVGAEPLAEYGSTDLSSHWMLGRTVIPRVPDAGALAEARAAGAAPRWLVAESDHYARLGTPEGATEVLRVRRRLGKDLLLLRVDPLPGASP